MRALSLAGLGLACLGLACLGAFGCRAAASGRGSGVPEGQARTMVSARARVLSEKPAPDGGKKVDLYAFELEAVLPGNDAGAAALPVPAELFPAEAPPSPRRSVMVFEENGQLFQRPMRDADMLLYAATDPEGLERDLSVLAEVTGLLGNPKPSAAPAPSLLPANGPPPDLAPLLDDGLLEALKRRRDLKRQLSEAEIRLEEASAALELARSAGLPDAGPFERAQQEARGRVQALRFQLRADGALRRVRRALDQAEQAGGR